MTALNVISDFFFPKRESADGEIISTKKQKEKTDFTGLVDKDSLHAPFPFDREQYPTYTQSGESFIRVPAIAGYPKRVYGSWLSELKRKKGIIDVVQYINSASNNSIITYYKKIIQNREVELLNIFDPYKKKMFQNYIDSANMQLDKYSDNSAAFVHQHMLVYLQANSLTELEDLTDNAKNTLVKFQVKPLAPAEATFQSFWPVMPIDQSLLSEYTYRGGSTKVASSMFPFDDTEILNLEPRSDTEGVNKNANSLVAVDVLNRNKTLDQNIVVIGTSRVGKTTYMI